MPPTDKDPLRHYVVNENGCHEWSQNRDRWGYGVKSYKGKTVRAHRLAYTLLVGPIPEGALILHLCHNAACINVEHLRPGTQAENMRMMVDAGRHVKAGGYFPETHANRPMPYRKATAETRDRIQALRADGWELRAIADEVGLSESHVFRILHGWTPRTGW